MKKLKRKHFIIEDNIFQTRVLFAVNYSIPETEKLLRRTLPDKHFNIKDMQLEHFSGKTCVLNKDTKTLRFVWLSRFSWTIIDMAIMAHEISHLVLQILKDRDIPINENNSEIIAYLNEFYIRESFLKLH